MKPSKRAQDSHDWNVEKGGFFDWLVCNQCGFKCGIVRDEPIGPRIRTLSIDHCKKMILKAVHES